MSSSFPFLRPVSLSLFRISDAFCPLSILIIYRSKKSDLNTMGPGQLLLRLLRLLRFSIVLLLPCTTVYSFAPKLLSSLGGIRTTRWCSSWTAASAAPASQILEFREPRTNVTVVLMGAMHYNPTSIQLAFDTVILSKFLQNEMRTACDVALQYNRPVILGDQRINITSVALKETLKSTVIDLLTPPTGWKRFYDDVQQYFQEAAPLGQVEDANDGTRTLYLNALSFFDARLWIAAPSSISCTEPNHDSPDFLSSAWPEYCSGQ
jgi:hypothetical protein